MEVKNKELEKLYDSVELYFDSWCLPSLITAFMICDDAIEGEIAAIKAELTEANQRLNNERKHGEDLADVNGQLASENVDLKAKLSLLGSSRVTWRSRAQHAEKEIEDLNKKISDLEEENANLRETPFDTLEALKKENGELRNGNKALSAMCESRLSALFETRKNAETYKKSFMVYYKENDRLHEVIDVLEKKIDTLKKKVRELEEEKARLKEAYDIHETTIKRLKLLLGKEREEKEVPTGDHEFKFGDKVLVPWSDVPYMYIKTSLMYNPRTESLVYVGKTQHLKWTGEKFEIK